MIEKDYELMYIGIHLAASKSRSWRDAVIRRFQTLIHFYQDNDLTTRELLAEGVVPDPEFKVMRSDITDVGDELYETGVQKWYTAIESGRPIEDTTILERELARIRAKNS